MSFYTERPDQEVIDLIKRSGDKDLNVAFAAQHELAKALEEPLRQGVLVGDVVTGLFTSMKLEPGASMEYPLDLLAPGEENNIVAFTNPGNGRIPEAQVEGDYVMLSTSGIAGSIDWLLRYARDARWDIVGRAMEVLQASFTKKINDSGFQVLLAAAADRNIMVFDADAAAGQFTKRLLSLTKVVMQRNGGGNTASLRRSKLTDMICSPETIEGIRNWNIDQVDEQTRRELYVAEDGTISRVFGVNLRPLTEFGEGQEYQRFFTDVLGASLASSDVELMIGLDMTQRGNLLMPIKENIQIFADPMLHRQQRQGYYGWGEFGFACLDNRIVIGASY
jgi:hypothetical protein